MSSGGQWERRGSVLLDWHRVPAEDSGAVCSSQEEGERVRTMFKMNAVWFKETWNRDLNIDKYLR